MKFDKTVYQPEHPMSHSLAKSAFINNDYLKETPTLNELARHISPVTNQTRCSEILERFLVEQDTYAIPVVDDNNKPLILLERKTFVEFFAKLFTREIYGHRPISKLLNRGDYESHVPIILEHTCTIDDTTHIIIEGGMNHMVTGIIVTDQELYKGLVSGYDLLNTLTQHKQAELSYLAHYDHLTGLPNRILLSDRLTQALLDAERKNMLVALLFIDVDRFKTINDSLGHSFGDAVLRTLSSRLQAVARQSDTVARIGGDEFVILMTNLSEPDDAERMALRLLKSMFTPVELLGHTLVITISIGIAIYPRDDMDPSRLLAKADAAMYEVKSAGRNGIQNYRAGQGIFDSSRLKLENDLRQAIASDGLQLHYQPQFDLGNRQVIGIEALVRWSHPTRGMIPPLEFISLAEECGLIHDLGEWVLREACYQMRSWQEIGFPSIHMSINVSALQFRRIDFTDTLMAIIEHNKVDPGLITLELTESVLMHDANEVLEIMLKIRELGVRLAIDDFGTGYSSLSYLRRFPISCLKIDQSFVRDIHHNSANESITKAIIALAKSLSLNVVAEGIETSAEKSVLETLGCTKGQGYYYSRPLSAMDFSSWVGENMQIGTQPGCQDLA